MIKNLLTLEYNKCQHYFTDKPSFEGLLRKYDAILIKKIPGGIDGFKIFSKKFGTKFTRYFGGITDPEGSHNNNGIVQLSITNGDLDVPHSSQFYEAQPIEILWIYCNKAPDSGGETLLCNGHDLFQSITPDIKKLIQDKQFIFHRKFNSQIWQKVYHVNSFDQFLRTYKTPELHARYDITNDTLYTVSFVPCIRNIEGKSYFTNTILLLAYGLKDYLLANNQEQFIECHIEEFGKIPEEIINTIYQMTMSNTYQIKLNSSDLIVIDNHRVMHGRNAFTGNRIIYNRRSFYS